MTIVRAQCTWHYDGLAPREGITITPHFKVLNPSPDYDTLATDLANQLKDFPGVSYRTAQLDVRLYDAQGAKPNYPLATKTLNAGAAPALGDNRKIAVCLSFYSEHNRPRYRGRLYLPAAISALATTGNFISTAVSNWAATIVPMLTGLGGVDVDWVVFSRKDNTSRPVTNWFIDNAYDTIRSRGLKATSRALGTTTEGNVPNIVSLVARPPAEDTNSTAAAGSAAA